MRREPPAREDATDVPGETKHRVAGIAAVYPRGRRGSLLKRSAILLAVLVTASGVARADVIHLKNGGDVEGEIAKESENEVELRIPSGSTTIARAEIDSIERKPTPDQLYEERRAALRQKPEDATERLALARFCLQHAKWDPKLHGHAVELALEAWKLAPSDAAVELLGKLACHLENGAWVRPEKWFPAHGYVRHGEEWLTTEDAALRAAREHAERARSHLHDAEHRIRKLEDHERHTDREREEHLADARRFEGELAAMGGRIKAAGSAVERLDHDYRARADEAERRRLDYVAESTDGRLEAYREAQASADRTHDALHSATEHLHALERERGALPKRIEHARASAATLAKRLEGIREDLARENSVEVQARSALQADEATVKGAQQAFEDRKEREAKAAAAEHAAIRAAQGK
jgi:hypothetical protein